MQILSIWDELPERIISVKPTLGDLFFYFQDKIFIPPAAYSSNEHGVSLTTFFNRVDKYEPSIIVVRTSDKEVSWLGWKLLLIYTHIPIMGIIFHFLFTVYENRAKFIYVH